jgi:pimeloyl-ACP methyl ester carboxylesterase
MKLGDWTIGRQSPTPVPEYEAEGDIDRVYHEIRQSLRVTGVNLLFRTWAGFEKFLPAAWDQVRPKVETVAFDQAGDAVREEAVRLAGSLGGTAEPDLGDWGTSRAYQIRAALDLYHYINPKLLVLVCAVRQALQGEALAHSGAAKAEPAPRGEPAKMYPMEMEEEKPDDKAVRRLFKDIQKTLSLPSINSDYRTLALWPDYLEAAWQRLKPVCQSPEFTQASDQLRQKAQELAGQLPHPMALSLGRVRELGEDADSVLETTKTFERLLPGLILNIAILHQTGKPGAEPQTAAQTAAASATPAPTASDWRAFQKRQHVLDWGDQFISYLDTGQGEPVVLLHGLPTWGFLWDKTIAALGSRFRVLVPDLLGYGYSAKRDSFDRSLARQTEMVDAFLQKLHIPSAHVVGHDLGGGIALRLATLFPQRVRSLSLMNSVCYDAWPLEMMLQLGYPGAARKVAPSATLKALQKGLLLGFNQPPLDEWLDGLLSPWRTEVGRLSLVRNAVALNTSHTTEITRLLPSIRVPTLVLWGEEDSFLPVRYAQRLASDIPGASLVRMAAARHFVMIDQPDRVHPALQQFLERQAAPAMQAAA